MTTATLHVAGNPRCRRYPAPTPRYAERPARRGWVLLRPDGSFQPCPPPTRRDTA